MSNKSSAVAEMGDRLATVDMGRKKGMLCPFLGGARNGPHVTIWPIMGECLPPYQVVS